VISDPYSPSAYLFNTALSALLQYGPERAVFKASSIFVWLLSGFGPFKNKERDFVIVMDLCHT